MEALKVIHKSALTTIQDLGRYGFMRYGVSICGALDKFALRIGNLLVGNSEGEAALEVTILGPKLIALKGVRLAFTGADLSPMINGIPSPMWCCITVKEGDIISFGTLRSGCRAYLCISGGIDVPLTMLSRSTHIRMGLGGFGRALAKGDVIQVKEWGRDLGKLISSNKLMEEQIPTYMKDWLVRIVLGPQTEYFTSKGLKTFLEGEYIITPESDRMGYRLNGPKIEHKLGADVITEATPPGSVEVPGDGKPIILLADALTTGGYPKIAVVISADQDSLAQAKPGDKIRFEKVNIFQAHKLLTEKENTVKKIRSSLILSP
jgi:antagonist of KipI